jgi:hypothetical protein
MNKKMRFLLSGTRVMKDVKAGKAQAGKRVLILAAAPISFLWEELFELGPSALGHFKKRSVNANTARSCDISKRALILFFFDRNDRFMRQNIFSAV